MISFVIPAYNEERLIGRTIESIRRAGDAIGEPFEIIVADDGSSDATASMAESRGARVVTVSNRQISKTRNSGARASTGEILIFVDADTEVTGDAVRGAVAAVRSGAVGGGCAVRFEGTLPLYARGMLFIAVPVYRWVGLAAGCFLYCTREAFESVGGFDETLFGGEEAIMSAALKRRGRFVILRQCVTTSGRKLRTHSAREILGLLVVFAFRGKRVLRKREGLDIWYGARRPDPDDGPPKSTP